MDFPAVRSFPSPPSQRLSSQRFLSPDARARTYPPQCQKPDIDVSP
jgi:hypothetical protein